MTGKILKISSNDLYGNVDDRQAVIFACFTHTKYMNNYVIFSFANEYDKNKLYYGSVHMKNNSLVIFEVKNNIKVYIDQFIEEYMSDKIENFKILNLDMMEKVELVSYSEMDFDKLQLLDDKSIYKKQEEVIEVKKKPVFLYFLIFVLILFSIGLTMLYFNPDMFTIKYRKMVCNNNLYDNSIGLYYDIKKDIRFDLNNKVESIDVVRTYMFLDSNSYYNFKDNDMHNNYFIDKDSYKYIDEQLKLKIFSQESSVIDDYDEMLAYMNREGYSCVESEYEK